MLARPSSTCSRSITWVKMFTVLLPRIPQDSEFSSRSSLDPAGPRITQIIKPPQSASSIPSTTKIRASKCHYDADVPRNFHVSSFNQVVKPYLSQMTATAKHQKLPTVTEAWTAGNLQKDRLRPRSGRPRFLYEEPRYGASSSQNLA